MRSARDGRCAAPVIAAPDLDAAVGADLCAVLLDTESLTQAVARAQSGAWLPQELHARRATLLAAQKGLEPQIERLTQAYLVEVLSLEEYGRRRHDRDERRHALGRQARQLEADAQRQVDLAGAAAGLRAFCERMRAGLETATFAQRRHLVELLLDRVIVTGDEVEIRYVIPTSPQGEQTRFYHLRIAYLRALSGQRPPGVPRPPIHSGGGPPAPGAAGLRRLLQ